MAGQVDLGSDIESMNLLRFLMQVVAKLAITLLRCIRLSFVIELRISLLLLMSFSAGLIRDLVSGCCDVYKP